MRHKSGIRAVTCCTYSRCVWGGNKHRWRRFGGTSNPPGRSAVTRRLKSMAASKGQLGRAGITFRQAQAATEGIQQRALPKRSSVHVLGLGLPIITLIHTWATTLPKGHFISDQRSRRSTIYLHRSSTCVGGVGWDWGVDLEG